MRLLKIHLLLTLFALLIAKPAMGQKPEDYPIATGKYRMTKNWTIHLGKEKFRRRVEKGSLVIWRPGLTMWIDIWGYPSQKTRNKFILAKGSATDLPKKAKKIVLPEIAGISRVGYYFKETEDNKSRWSLQTFTFGPRDHVQMAIYFDKEKDLELAMGLWKSVTHASK